MIRWIWTSWLAVWCKNIYRWLCIGAVSDKKKSASWSLESWRVFKRLLHLFDFSPLCVFKCRRNAIGSKRCWPVEEIGNRERGGVACDGNSIISRLRLFLQKVSICPQAIFGADLLYYALVPRSNSEDFGWNVLFLCVLCKVRHFFIERSLNLGRRDNCRSSQVSVWVSALKWNVCWVKALLLLYLNLSSNRVCTFLYIAHTANKQLGGNALSKAMKQGRQTDATLASVFVRHCFHKIVAFWLRSNSYLKKENSRKKCNFRESLSKQ